MRVANLFDRETGVIATIDRAVVLLLGVAVGCAIGLAFAGGSASAPAAAIVAGAGIDKLPASAPAPADTEAALVERCAPCFQLAQDLRQSADQGGRVRIGVFGDSFGKGVWSGVLQQLPSKQGFDVTDYGQEAIGFTRYKSLNLEQHLADQLGNQNVDIAVISFGANDAQGIITPEGHYAPFMGPLWQQTLAGRLERYIAILRRHKAMVYWVGLPRMRDPGLDAQVTQINDFYHAQMNRLGVPFLDSRPVASDAKGEFAPYLIDPRDGKQTQIRVGDGIHMTMTGYVWITRDLVARIRNYVASVRTIAGVAAPQPPAKKAA